VNASVVTRARCWRTGLLIAFLTFTNIGLADVAEVTRSPDGKGQGAALVLTLRPLPGSSRDEVGRVQISLDVRGSTFRAGEPLLQIPLVYANVPTVAENLTDLQVSDAKGQLKLSYRDLGQMPASTRQWITDRDVVGDLRVRYSVPAAARVAPRGPAPPLELRTGTGAFSGAGRIFLLLPPHGTDYWITVEWDLSALPPGAMGVSSLGQGQLRSPALASLDSLERSYFMAGVVHRYPVVAAPTGFSSAWTGQAPFDAEALMSWAGRLYQHYTDFLGDGRPHLYTVFMRENPVNAGGGFSLDHGFIATFGDRWPGNDADFLRFTLAHEMFHTFQPMIGAEADSMLSAWFNEGLAVYYARRLPLRFGLVTSAQFLLDLNAAAATYYTDLFAAASNTEAANHFWTDSRYRMLAYTRGSFYFATVDEAVRKASHKRRSLDDLVLAMLERQRSKHSLSVADWEDIVAKEIGPAARAQLHSFLEGALQLPSSSAFGPCFIRTRVRLRRFDLGFEPEVLTEPDRVIRGVETNSEAYRAGVRDGDVIVFPVPQDALQSSQTAQISLLIRRDGHEFPVTYLPRGEALDAPQWQRIAGVAESSCGQ
jgi:predicted metalloprotease with PDZ domain